MSFSKKFRVYNKTLKHWLDQATIGNDVAISLDGKRILFYWDEPSYSCGKARYGTPGFDYVIQQWTGLYDKNGKEIFEGDLIKGDGYGPYPVEWHKVSWCSSCYSDVEPISQYRIIEVMGNILQNADLIAK